MSHHRETISTPNAPRAIGPYSQAVATANLVFVSGQLGFDPASMALVEGGVREQTRQALRNLTEILTAGGCGLADVTACTVYLKDMNDFTAMNEVYATFLQTPRPAAPRLKWSAFRRTGWWKSVALRCGRYDEAMRMGHTGRMKFEGSFPPASGRSMERPYSRSTSFYGDTTSKCEVGSSQTEKLWVLSSPSGEGRKEIGVVGLRKGAALRARVLMPLCICFVLALAIHGSAVAQVQRETVVTDGAPKAIGPYSQAVVAGNMVFVSGQLGLDPTTGVFVEGGVREQTERALRNIAAILEKAGCTPGDAVSCSVFLRNLADFSVMNDVYTRFFPASPPARTTVEVSGLPKNGLVEINCIAIRK